MDQKLRFNLDDLVVESFSTSEPANGKGTVHGRMTYVQDTCPASPDCVETHDPGGPSNCTLNLTNCYQCYTHGETCVYGYTCDSDCQCGSIGDTCNCNLTVGLTCQNCDETNTNETGICVCDDW